MQSLQYVHRVTIKFQMMRNRAHAGAALLISWQVWWISDCLAVRVHVVMPLAGEPRALHYASVASCTRLRGACLDQPLINVSDSVRAIALTKTLL